MTCYVIGCSLCPHVLFLQAQSQIINILWGNITNSIFFADLQTIPINYLYNYCGGLRIKIFSDNLLLFAVRLYGIP